MEGNTWLEVLQTVGWPSLFAFGLYKGWWRMGGEDEYKEFLKTRNAKLEGWVEAALSVGERNATVAEAHVARNGGGE